MASLFLLEGIFILIAFMHMQRQQGAAHAFWVLIIPCSLLLSLILDLAERGAAVLHDPIFILCLQYTAGLSLFAACSFIGRYYTIHRRRRPR